jgi:hypothetical protein
MTRRTTPAAKRDDDGFPIRVKLAVPPHTGFGNRLNDIHAWLRSNLPKGGFAVHSARMIGGDAMAVYFNAIEDAVRFLEAFPDCALALAPAWARS